MQIVIDIPEEKYNEYKRIGDSRDVLFEAIRNGTPLLNRKRGKITMSKSNKINNLINELHKDQMELMKLLKIYIGMETFGLCISSLDPEDKNYKIIHDYLLARVDDLYELSDDAHLTVL